MCKNCKRIWTIYAEAGKIFMNKSGAYYQPVVFYKFSTPSLPDPVSLSRLLQNWNHAYRRK